MSDLIPRDTITEIVAYRDAAVKLFEDFFAARDAAQRLADEAHEALHAACGGSVSAHYASRTADEVQAFEAAVKAPDITLLRRTARRLVDAAVWGSIVERTQLEALMDKTAKDDLRRQMEYVPERVDPSSGQVINGEEIERAIPPVTEENVEATLSEFVARSDEIWMRGIATAFSSLDRRFRSHDGFKVGDRVILSRAFGEGGSWNYYMHHRDTLLDIERVFLMLDGKGPRMAYGGIVGLIDSERGSGYYARQSEHEGDYFRVRVFKNGNAHLWFTRKDLVQKINRLLADYYGAGLGWGSAERDASDPRDEARERSLATSGDGGFGFFPTPDAIAERVIAAARLWVPEGSRALTVLEPSAGKGDLARKAVEAGCRVTCMEVQPRLFRELTRVEGVVDVLLRDFLTVEPNGHGFDRVVMNPPFDRGRDVDHVRHALRFVRPGGRLVAVMSQSAEFSDSPRARALRRELEALGGNFQDLPEGSFREYGTSVNTVLLTVDVPVGDEDERPTPRGETT